ncbi:KTSC domain-containing protein [Yersinia enterocolitica]|uniref:KTSC domain-containing protein n=1 Tax=Yersinia enterocolitica TaxID=630 RepID=UPI0005E4C73B|nr:KTSC domain-containing protein [Yersinia enterocolitica]EKN3576301.1 KTSC domain-containing protein [Yersinia enterocolitica]EKN3580357.1 KTSC domain-containing protein [Yersinia enterocolitica]EKN4022636.1 KTSC domain-containing protein [Yersinia enterocolitica]EKN4086092.1 KTSC domain-containing protein [Yersinia enterocolitica]EKN4110616.1 KTSC domain-containing protein [Yersinia enterocolitica]
MERTYVDSSNLESVGYDSTSNVLEVEFKNGSLYQYLDVPEHIFPELITASSVGIYFNENIRNNYECQRI